MGRNWGVAMQPTRPRGDSQTQLTVLLKTIGLDASAANVYLTLAGGVYSFFTNVSALSVSCWPLEHLSGWTHTLAACLLHSHLICHPLTSSAPMTAPWLSIVFPLIRREGWTQKRGGGKQGPTLSPLSPTPTHCPNKGPFPWSKETSHPWVPSSCRDMRCALTTPSSLGFCTCVSSVWNFLPQFFAWLLLTLQV